MFFKNMIIHHITNIIRDTFLKLILIGENIAFSLSLQIQKQISL